MHNKTIIEFGFRIIWRIMEISEGVIRLFFPPSFLPTWLTAPGSSTEHPSYIGSRCNSKKLRTEAETLF